MGAAKAAGAGSEAGRGARLRGVGLVLIVVASACGAPAGSGLAAPPAWRSSEKLDGRTRDALAAYQAYHYPFAFDLALRRPFDDAERSALSNVGIAIEGSGLEVRARSLPAAVRELVEHEAVRSVTCTRYPGGGEPPLEGWQQHVNPEAVIGWHDDPCWIAGHIEIEGPLDDSRLETLAELGILTPPEPSERSISAVVPRDALPTVVSLSWVLRFLVEPAAQPN